MNHTPHRVLPQWSEIALSIGVVAILIIALWRPDQAAPATHRPDRLINELANLLGAPSRSAAEIDKRLGAFSRFPPDPRASRALAEALVMCTTTMLGGLERRQLAQQLYVITEQSTDADHATTVRVIDLQRMLGGVCSATAIGSLGDAARRVARTDPSPRRDWW